LFFSLNYCFAAVVLIATNKVEYTKYFQYSAKFLRRVITYSLEQQSIGPRPITNSK